jgi:hypothetical protein
VDQQYLIASIIQANTLSFRTIHVKCLTLQMILDRNQIGEINKPLVYAYNAGKGTTA